MEDLDEADIILDGTRVLRAKKNCRASLRRGAANVLRRAAGGELSRNGG
jgi:hypothetical protein